MIPPPDSKDPPDGPPYFAPWLLGPTSYIFAGKEVLDSRDPPGRSVRSIVISGRERVRTYILVDVEARTCRSRGAYVS